MRWTTRMVMALLVLGCLSAATTAAVAQQRVVVEERQATILKKVGNTVVIRNDKGEIKQYSNLPPDFTLTVDGKPAKLEDLREGMVVQAVRFQDVPPPTTVTMAQVEQLGREPAAAPAPPAAAPPAAAPAAPAPAEAPAAEPAQLPPTASYWPTLAAMGALLLLTGLALRRRVRG